MSGKRKKQLQMQKQQSTQAKAESKVIAAEAYQDGYKAGLEMDFRQGFEQGIRIGWNHMTELFQEFIDPIFQELIMVNLIIGQILGIAVAGFGELPKEQIKELTGSLMDYLTRLDFSVSRASQIFEMDGVINTAPVHQLYQAAKRYYTDEDAEGTELKNLAISSNILSSNLLQLRLRPGLKPGRIADEWLNDRIIELYDEGRGTHQEVGLFILKELKGQNLLPIMQQKALETLENIPYERMGTIIRQRYNRHKKRRKTF